MKNSDSELTAESATASVAAGLDALTGVAVLHGRTIPGTRAAIGHVAVGPSGVYVIETHANRGAVVRRDSRLFVDGQDRSHLVAAMKVPVDAVAAALGALHLPISRALCFTGGDWPASTPAFMLKGVWVGWSNPLYGLVAQPGRLQPREIDTAIHMLDDRLPPG